jgi:hypothetical protein
MADEDASLRRTWRGNALEGCRKRAVQAAPHDVPLRVKEAEIMARDPVPAEDDVKAGLRSRGDMSMASRRWAVAPRARCTCTGGGNGRVVSGEARLTAVGPGIDDDGSCSRRASCAQMKQWVAPESSMIVTRRRPDGDQTKPATMGLHDGSLRCQGEYVACWAWSQRARARASHEQYQ